MYEHEVSPESQAAIDRFNDRIGCPSNDLPAQFEKFSDIRRIRSTHSPHPKFSKGSIHGVNNILARYAVFDGEGIAEAEVERAEHSRDQILDTVQILAEAALPSMVESAR